MHGIIKLTRVVIVTVIGGSKGAPGAFFKFPKFFTEIYGLTPPPTGNPGCAIDSVDNKRVMAIKINAHEL